MDGFPHRGRHCEFKRARANNGSEKCGADDDLRILRYRGLPEGWRVAQLDSGHYIVIDPAGEQQSCITVSHVQARRWAKRLGNANQA